MKTLNPHSTRPFWQQFLLFLLPLIATNILQSLSGTINTIFVGQMMGVNAIAAISVFFPILFCLMAFIIGLSAGATVLVGQAWGKGETEQVQAITGATLFMTLIGGACIAAFGVYFAQDILLGLGTDQSLIPLALPYVQTMLAGSPILFVYIIYTSILRGVGDSKTPLLALGMTSGIGLVVTPTLIKGWFGLPQLGILAPAVATILGYVLVLLFLTVYLNRRRHILRINSHLLSRIRFSPSLSPLILKLGVPTGIQMVTNSLAGLVIIGLVNGFGPQATAAYGAVNQVNNYVQFPAMSISIAASIFAAQAKQNVLGKIHPKSGNDDAADERHEQGCARDGLHLLFFTLAPSLSHQNRRPCRQANDEGHQAKQNREKHRNRRNRVHAHHLPHKNGVDGA